MTFLLYRYILVSETRKAHIKGEQNMYNMVYEYKNEKQARIRFVGKHGHKHFNSKEEAEKWATDNQIKPVKLQIWDDEIDCFSTIKAY